jgi:hypothetical protein
VVTVRNRDHLPRAELERQVVEGLVYSLADRRDRSEAWTRLILDVKNMALEGDIPASIADHIRHALPGVAGEPAGGPAMAQGAPDGEPAAVEEALEDEPVVANGHETGPAAGLLVELPPAALPSIESEPVEAVLAAESDSPIDYESW